MSERDQPDLEQPQTHQAHVRRAQSRRWLLGGAAVGAALAGVGWGWWRLQPHASAPDAQAGLWQLKAQTPAGAPLDMQALRGHKLLVNFWATWCPPCVHEMPLLDAFYKENVANGWQVLGLALDQAVAVQSFLGRVPVSFPVAVLGLEGMNLMRNLGNLTGGLPFSVILGASGQILHRKIGAVSTDDLQQWARLR